MKKKKWMIYGVVLLFLAGMGAGLYWSTPEASQSRNRENIPVQSVAQLTGYAEELEIRPHYLGILASQEPEEILLDTGRQVARFSVAEGGNVTAGAEVALYDTGEQLLEIEQLELEIRQSKLSVESSQVQIQTLQKQKKGATAEQKQEYDLQIRNEQAKIDQEKYNQSLKEKQIQALEELIAGSQVLAPCTGVVTEIQEEEGRIVIVPEGTYALTFSVSEQEVEGISAGQKLQVTDRRGRWESPAEVQYVETDRSQDQEETGGQEKVSQYLVHASLKEEEACFAGQHVYVQLEEDTEEAGQGTEILLPEGYLQDPETSAWVWAVNQEGTLEKRKVTLGDYNDRKSAYVIEEGLAMTDYLAWPAEYLREGQEADFQH